MAEQLGSGKPSPGARGELGRRSREIVLSDCAAVEPMFRRAR